MNTETPPFEKRITHRKPDGPGEELTLECGHITHTVMKWPSEWREEQTVYCAQCLHAHLEKLKKSKQ